MFYAIFTRFLKILPWVFPSFFLLYVVLTTPPGTMLVFLLAALWLSFLILDEPNYLQFLKRKITTLQKAYASFSKEYL